MKKIFKLVLILSLFSGRIFAQFGQITNVQIIPANPTNVDQLYAVIDVMLGSSPCDLDVTSNLLMGSNYFLNAYYCEGMLSTICNRTDTVSIGTFPAGSYNLNVGMYSGCGPYTSVDTPLVHSFTVGVFSGLNAVDKTKNFSIYPNPTNNSIVNLQSVSLNKYSLICLNSLGQQVFEMNNLTGNQAINLPKENGIYFLKVIDHQNQTSVLKCLNISK
jgi:hypothetical protein